MVRYSVLHSVNTQTTNMSFITAFYHLHQSPFVIYFFITPDNTAVTGSGFIRSTHVRPDSSYVRLNLFTAELQAVARGWLCIIDRKLSSS